MLWLWDSWRFCCSQKNVWQAFLKEHLFSIKGSWLFVTSSSGPSLRAGVAKYRVASRSDKMQELPFSRELCVKRSSVRVLESSAIQSNGQLPWAAVGRFGAVSHEELCDSQMSRAGSPGAFVAELCCTLEDCCHERPFVG